MNKLLRKLNQLNFRTQKGRNFRRNRNRNLIRRNPPLLSKRPQKFGQGSPIRYITLNYTIEPPNLNTFLIGSDLITNQEYREYATNYNFCRVLAIKVIIKPFNFINTTDGLYLKMNWVGSYEDKPSVMNSDVSKFVGAVNPRNTVFTFIPPSVSLGSTTIPSFYTQTLTSGYIFRLHAVSGISTNLLIGVEVAMMFRTPRDYSTSSVIIRELKDKIVDEIIKIQNDEKVNKENEVKLLNEELKVEDEKEGDEEVEEDIKIKKRKKNKK